ncbi:MAG: alpha-glucosidase [Intestinibaculum porci]|uniref:alpha-glucosidase n=1 Tax=Intestinibaculum porci TaxID=2487118 RepID=UPI003F04D784
MNKAWWKEAVVYQIYPRSFNDSNGDGIGDLQGIISRLDYLENLGVDVIWLSPVYASPNEDNGYDISDYYAIMSDFGTMRDFDELLQKAHEHHLKIVMDLVANHTSDEHQWFIDSRKSKDNPYHDYYIWRDQPNNWGSVFGGSAWQYDENLNQYYLHNFAIKQPDLNWENKAVRDDLYKMMRYWCDKGIDGFRMDVISMISKDQRYPDAPVPEGAVYGDPTPYTVDGPRIHEFLQEMNREVLSRYDLFTVGETPGLSVERALKYVQEDRHELEMVFTFDHVSLDGGDYGKWSQKRTDLVELKKAIMKWVKGCENGGWNSLYLDNHDQPRAVSRFGDDGEYREMSAKCLALTLHLMRGTPYVYQGEELGMTNYHFTSIEECRDIEEINAYKDLVTDRHIYSDQEMLENISSKGRDNARTPMQWDDSQNAGFTTGTPWINVNPNYKTINAAAQVNEPNSIYNFYKQLIALRHAHDIIVYGEMDLLYEDAHDLFAYTRSYNDEKITVLANWSDHEVTYDLTPEGDLLITNDEDVTPHTLKPYQAVAYYKK